MGSFTGKLTLITAEAVAWPTLFLAWDEPRYTAGQTYLVDGGFA